MITNLPKKLNNKEFKQNVTDSINGIQKDTITYRNTDNDVISTVNTYQVFLNRFRRKNTDIALEIINKSNDITKTYDKKINSLAKDLKKIPTLRNRLRLIRQNKNIDKIEERQKKKETMAKIKLDDSTQARLFHDYTMTVNRSVLKEGIVTTYPNLEILKSNKNHQDEKHVKFKISNNSLAPANLTHPLLKNVSKPKKPPLTEGK